MTGAAGRWSRLAAAAVAVLVLPALTASSPPGMVRAFTVLPQQTAACNTSSLIRIMPVGDSITVGVGSSPGQSRSYRGWLRNRFATAPMTATYVGSQSDESGQFEAYSGISAGQLIPKVEAALDAYTPDYVIFDVGNNPDSLTDYALTYNKVVELLDLIRAHPCIKGVIVAKMTLDLNAASKRSLLQQYVNDRIAGVVAARPDTVLVDFSLMTPGDLYDSLHPNDLGYDRMSCKLYYSLARVIGVIFKATACPYSGQLPVGIYG